MEVGVPACLRYTPTGEANDQYNDHMARKLTATEVKAKLLALLNEVELGEEIEITRHGVTVARLAPARGPHALKGRFAGVAMSAAGDAELFSTGATWDLP
jgi:prevent-host-death family protein